MAGGARSCRRTIGVRLRGRTVDSTIVRLSGSITMCGSSCGATATGKWPESTRHSFILMALERYDVDEAGELNWLCLASTASATTPNTMKHTNTVTQKRRNDARQDAFIFNTSLGAKDA
jgi:hypothetical protein